MMTCVDEDVEIKGANKATDKATHKATVRKSASVRAVTGQRVITIDGPAASGKSSVSRLVAEALGVAYLSSGLLYRAATYLAQRSGRSLSDEAALLELLSTYHVELFAPVGERNQIAVDGQLLGAELHTDAVDAGVSAVARHPGVRRWVDARLREVEGAFVVEGRDMGTTVFPDAAYKVYLSAPAEVRAARRVGERRADLEAVSEALKRRDALDAAQSYPAADAVHLDTRDLSLDAVVAWVLGVVAGITDTQGTNTNGADPNSIDTKDAAAKDADVESAGIAKGTGIKGADISIEGTDTKSDAVRTTRNNATRSENVDSETAFSPRKL